MKSLEETIKYCMEVIEEQSDFKTATRGCEYWHIGWEDQWVDTCRHPDNIPEGCSWGKCNLQVCPIFDSCIQCAEEHRQLAEWLMELQRIKKLLGYLNEHPCSGCVFHTENGCCKWDCVFDKDINYGGGKNNDY